MSTAAPFPSDLINTGNVSLPTPEQLPDEPDTLKRMIIELVTTLHRERLDKDALRHRISLLLTRLYGPRTERVHPDQLLLFAEWAAEQTPDAANGNTAPPLPQPDTSAVPAGKKRRCKPHGRGRLSEDLPRRPLHHELSEAERICICGQTRIDIGSDVNEQVDWQPASLFIWQHLVHKYLCPTCSKKSARTAMTPVGQSATHTNDAVPNDAVPNDAVPNDAVPNDAVPNDAVPTDTADATKSTSSLVPSEALTLIGPAIIAAPKPPPPIAKGLPGAGLLAYIIVSKYFDHLPLNRQEHILKRQGLPLSRSTMCDWMAASAQALRPLYDIMVAEVLQSAWLHTDDTPVKNQGHEPGTTALSRLWIYWGDRSHPYNVFDFTINRRRDGPQKFLADFHGYLHADAFSGYDALYLPSPRLGAAPIFEVACNAHARRKFHEARDSDVVRSHQALAYYRQLYELERAATTAKLDDDQRRQMRQDFSVPILDKMHDWLVEQRPQVLPKSPMAEAIGYALNNWTALIRYTEAGFLSIDNNVAEREMKRIAIGRKNWLFFGSDQGGRTAAILYSFTSTCHRLGVEPWAYLQDVLTRLPTMPVERLAELLPDRWQSARRTAASTDGKPSTSAPPAPDSHPK
jgi:transposase